MSEQSSDGQALEGKCRSAEQPRSTQVRGARWRGGTVTIPHTGDFHLCPTSNLNWKGSEFWQTLLSSRQEPPFPPPFLLEMSLVSVL